jgi:hypothetical protein
MALKEVPISTVDNPALPNLQRKDAYWVQPLLTFIGLVAFGIYVTWRAFENGYYEAPAATGLNYLTPFYSPKFSIHWMVGKYHFSPALLILPIPLLFRATCYYYRKAYYRAFFADPTSCAVKEPFARKNYTGERAFPLVLQNIHRYAFYLAALVMIVLWWDTVLAFTIRTPQNPHHLYVGLGSIIFLVNVILLSLFTFSCNSWRHLTGGCLNCYSCSGANTVRHGIWEKVTHWNERHSLWAWLSLFSVWLADLYVRCLATGAIHDVRFF